MEAHVVAGQGRDERAVGLDGAAVTGGGELVGASEEGLLLKPSNVLVGAGDEPKLLDFGVATSMLSREPGLQPGTPLYMSPEQARGELLDRRSDVHALGTVTFELLTGRPPVSDRSLAEVLAAKQRPAPLVRTFDPSLDADLDHVLARALALDPDARCPDAGSFARDLRAVAGGLPLPWRGGGVLYRTERFGKRHRSALRRLAAAAAVVGVVGAVAGAARVAETRRADARVRQRVERIEGLIGAAQGEGAHRDALAAVDGFVADPEHAGHPEAYRVWLAVAGMQPVGSRERFDALASAYQSASDDAGVARVQVALGEAFHATADWEALGQLEEVLLPEAAAKLVDVRRRARLARRDVDGALALDPERRWLGFLGEATPVGNDRRAMWFDVVGDEVPELVIGDRTEVRGPLGTPSYGRLEAENGVAGLGSYARDGADVVDAVRVGDRTVLRRFTPGDGDWRWHQVADVAGFGAQDLQRVRTSVGPRWLVGSAYPLRDALLVGDDGSSRSLAATRVGSDVREALILDVDGDGIDEVVLAVGSWSGYAVRLYRDVGDGYAMAAERVLGVVPHLARIDGPDGPLVVAAKADEEADPRFFGDEQPFGPPAGLYLLDPRDGLAERGFVPFPLPDHVESTPARGIGSMFPADVDGDGKVDLVSSLYFLDLSGNNVLWVVKDLLGERDQVWVASLQALGAADVDGDGRDEVLVREDDHDLWVLGVGDDRLPAWTPARSKRLAMPAAPAELDPALQREWGRVQQLASLGLTPQAVDGLDRLAAQVDRDTQGRAGALIHRATGDLLDRSERPAEAATRHLQAQGLGDDTAAAAAVRSLGEAVRWADARALAASTPDALPFLADQPVLDLLAPEVVDRWRIEVPGVVRRGPDGLWVDAMNDMGVLLEVPVQVVGRAASLALSLQLEEVELGSGLSFELVPEGSEAIPIGVRLWGQGGGGNVKVRRHCFGPEERELGHSAYTRGMVVAPRAGLFPDGRLRCGHHSQGGGTAGSTTPWLPWSRARTFCASGPPATRATPRRPASRGACSASRPPARCSATCRRTTAPGHGGSCSSARSRTTSWRGPTPRIGPGCTWPAATSTLRRPRCERCRRSDWAG